MAVDVAIYYSRPRLVLVILGSLMLVAAFIARQSTFKRMALKSSLRLGGTPIAIPRVVLSMDLEELESIIRSRWRAAHQPPASAGGQP